MNHMHGIRVDLKFTAVRKLVYVYAHKKMKAETIIFQISDKIVMQIKQDINSPAVVFDIFISKIVNI